MPDQQSSSSSKKPKPHKDEMLKARIDPELHEQAQKKAKDMGWSLGSVVRALLRLWVQEDVVSSKDIGEEAGRAPKQSKKKTKGKK
jgi:hypothetical protein